jgi:hypothetical protein
MKILVCAATPVEVLACQRGIEKSGDSRFEVLQTGMGMENARNALKMRLHKGKPDLVVSSGFAGIWRGDFKIGDWIGASEVWSRTGGKLTQVGCVVEPFGASIPFVSVDEIGPAPSDLEMDRVAVDMESAGLAQICRENEIAFSVFRMITDTPSAPLPDFVSSWTAAFQTPKWEDKFTFGSKGLMEAVQNFGTVKKFLVDGRQWALDLQQGWADNASKFKVDV